jgi:hypothetical protein
MPSTVGFTLLNTTRGRFTTVAPGYTALSDITAMGVYNGSLYFATYDNIASSSAIIYKYLGGMDGGVTTVGFTQVSNQTKGKIASTDAQDIRAVTMLKTYQCGNWHWCPL